MKKAASATFGRTEAGHLWQREVLPYLGGLRVVGLDRIAVNVAGPFLIPGKSRRLIRADVEAETHARSPSVWP
jgi:hypothetical protein